MFLGIPKGTIPGPIERATGDPGFSSPPAAIPRLTLFGPVAFPDTAMVPGIFSSIRGIASVSDPFSYTVDPRVFHFPRTGLLRYPLTPSPSLIRFAREVQESLEEICCNGGGSSPGAGIGWFLDHDPSSVPPARRAFGLPPAPDAHSHPVASNEDPRALPVAVEPLRVSILAGDRIFAEFDLPTGRWLVGDESRDTSVIRKTLQAFRRQRGYEVRPSGRSQGGNVFLISDLHLGHANGIPRFHRPFMRDDVEEMNHVLIRNWNHTVSKDDTVLFLGDLAFRSSVGVDDYLPHLAGKIIFIEGNHDPHLPTMLPDIRFAHDGIPFMAIHNPEELRGEWDGWLLHGHFHNTRPVEYPFFNPASRRVNVSAEVLGYRPVPLSYICRLIRTVQEPLTSLPGT